MEIEHTFVIDAIDHLTATHEDATALKANLEALQEEKNKIDMKYDEIQDEIQVIRMKLDTIEQNTHPNRDIDEKKYNK